MIFPHCAMLLSCVVLCLPHVGGAGLSEGGVEVGRGGIGFLTSLSSKEVLTAVPGIFFLR